MSSKIFENEECRSHIRSFCKAFKVSNLPELYLFAAESPHLFFMPPTSKKLQEHIGFGLCICASVCPCIRSSKTVHARVLKFHIWIPHGKIADPYFFSCPSYLPFWSYAPLKKSE